LNDNYFISWLPLMIRFVIVSLI